MTVGSPYKVTKRIKLHTSPLREAEIVKAGVFKKETRKSYIFNEFKVKKQLLQKIEIVEKYDTTTIAEFVKRLEEHYPHSPSVMATVYDIATKMLRGEK